MMLAGPAVGRAVAAGATCWAVLFGGAAFAVAESAPNCTAANLARISSGVSNATADYLTANNEVNTFFTSLKGQDSEMLRANVETYLNANLQVKDDLQGIRQPLAEFETRCS